MLRFRAVRLLPLFLAFVILSSFAEASDGGYLPPANTPIVPWKVFSIKYTTRSIGGSGPKKVEFYITTDGGQTWKLYGEDKDRRSPMTISVSKDGVYGFMTVGTDRHGNREREPVAGTRPETFIIVDRTPPTAKWISPSSSALLDEKGITLAWSCADDHLGSTPIKIQYSTNGGKAWLPLRDKLPAAGSFDWKRSQIPEDRQLAFRLIARDRAGNSRIVRASSTIHIDRTAPTAALRGPRLSQSQKVDLEYTAADAAGGTGLARVALYYTNNNGRDWHFFGEDADLKSPFSFVSSQSGRIGLTLVAADNAGNQTPAPKDSDQPAFTLVIDDQPPVIQLKPNFPKNSIHSDTTVPINWSATDPLIKADSARLEYSIDGGQSWTMIDENLPVNHTFGWKVPALPTKDKRHQCYLRLTVGDQLGNIGKSQSQAFTIDPLAPVTTVKNVSPKPAPANTSSRYQELNEIRPIGSKPSGDEKSATDVTPPESKKEEPSEEEKTYNVSTPKEPGMPGSFNEFLDPIADLSPEDKTPEPRPEPVENSIAKQSDPIPSATNKIDDATPETRPDVIPAPVDSGDESAPEASPLPKPFPDTVESTDNETDSTTDDKITGIIPSELEKRPVGQLDETADVNPIDPIPAKDPTSDDNADSPDDKSVAKTALSDDDAYEKMPSETDIGMAEKKEPSSPVSTPKGNANEFIAKAQEAIRAGRFDLAENYCSEALKLDPNSAMAHAYMSTVLSHNQSFKNAILHARKAVAIENRQEYHLVLGEAYLQYARSIAAASASLPKTDVEQILKLREEMVKVLNQASATFQHVRRLAPESKAGVEKLADVEYFRARSANETKTREAAYKRAIKLYQQSFSLANGTYKEAFQIGVCYYSIRDYENAQTWLERAVEHAENESPKEAVFYLGKLHDEMQRPSEALPYWKVAEEQYPSGNRFHDHARKRRIAIERQLESAP